MHACAYMHMCTHVRNVMCVCVCPCCLLGTESSFLLNESYCYAFVDAASDSFCSGFSKGHRGAGRREHLRAHPAVPFLIADQNNHVGQEGSFNTTTEYYSDLRHFLTVRPLSSLAQCQ